MIFKHPTAVVETDDIGDGTKIWHFAHVREKAKIGRFCNIGKGVYIDAGVEVGNNVKIQNFVSLYRGVRIEDDVFIGPSATFTNDLYPRAYIWDDSRVVPTEVKRGASIGANATVLCGVTVGEYAMIGAGSVLTEDAVPFGLYYGVPARLRGFVCFCGKKLSKVAEEAEEAVVFSCACGKRVAVQRAWFNLR